MFLCLSVHIPNSSVPFKARRRQLPKCATSELREKSPEYFEDLTSECKSIGEFLNLATKYENLDISQLNDVVINLAFRFCGTKLGVSRAI